ncbi:MAG: ComF family protein [Butyrivibrio sp.]|nr:ComF family protein [Butyrivibrio sp.]
MLTGTKEIKDVFRVVKEIVYPGRCPVCDGILNTFEIKNGKIKRGGLIHKDCIKKIRYVKQPTCIKCGKGLKGADADREFCEDCSRTRHLYDRGFSLFEYRSISGSIYRFKYMGRQEYADFYARATKRVLGDTLSVLGIDLIVPVPMYPKKVLERGYNQAEIYAKKVSELLDIPMCANLVGRTRNTLPMKNLDVRGRRNNLKKAFNIQRNDVKFKCILIIDDIYTTGSTIDEMAHSLRQAGAEKIYFLTLAIGQTT